MACLIITANLNKLALIWFFVKFNVTWFVNQNNDNVIKKNAQLIGNSKIDVT